jgi:YesN/AraC family two-component response regulator
MNTTDLSAPISVLLVDDEPALVRALARRIGNTDIVVHTAYDADSALETLDREAIDVIISDIDMPGKSGLELLAIVRQQHPSTVRMLLTGAVTADRALAAINSGEVARFFAKPCDTRIFREAIIAMKDRIDRARREALERTRAARVAALRSWAETMFPGTCTLERTNTGALHVDPAAIALLR